MGAKEYLRELGQCLTNPWRYDKTLAYENRQEIIELYERLIKLVDVISDMKKDIGLLMKK